MPTHVGKQWTVKFNIWLASPFVCIVITLYRFLVERSEGSCLGSSNVLLGDRFAGVNLQRLQQQHAKTLHIIMYVFLCNLLKIDPAVA